LNKTLQPSDPRRLDSEALRELRQVATEFAFFSSVAKVKDNSEGSGVCAFDAITTMLADAVGRSEAGTASLTEKPQQRADAFAAHLVWLSEAPLLPGRGYLLKAGAHTVGAMVIELKYRVDIEALEHLAAKELHRNEIAFVNVATAEPISFDPYEENKATGGFMLIDRHSNATVAVGLIRFGLRRAANTYFQSFEVTKTARAQLKGHKPALLWFTGKEAPCARQAHIRA
jgi:bifunctional enzyme CysN/CysC